MPISNREIKEVRFENADEEPYALQQDFWKLGNSYKMSEDDIKGELEDLNAFFVETESEERLLTRLYRAQAGQLCYDRYDLEELLGFARERGLTLTAEDDRVKVIQDLEYADDNPSFTRLFDLPFELRREIYYYACEPEGGELRQPVQPPLCKASRALRVEALPVLYRNLTLNISVHHDFDLKSVILTDAARHMLDTLQEEQFANLKGFIIMNYSDDQSEYDPEMTNADVCWSLEHDLKAKHARDWWTETTTKEVKDLFKEPLEGLWLQVWMTKVKIAVNLARHQGELTLTKLKAAIE